MVRPVVNAVQLLGFLSTIVALSVLAGVGIFWMKSDLICAINPPDSWLDQSVLLLAARLAARPVRGRSPLTSIPYRHSLPFVRKENVLPTLGNGCVPLQRSLVDRACKDRR
jgi:hypothetical protein